MFCLVDPRNRPDLGHKFSSRRKAQEYLKKINNNPFGVTAIFPDGRREYFENGVPSNLINSKFNSYKLKKGCHLRFRISKISSFDGVLFEKIQKTTSKSDWRKNSLPSLFMFGNRRLYGALAFFSLALFSSIYFFESHLGKGLLLPNQGKVLGAETAKLGFSDVLAESSVPSISDEDLIYNLLSKIEKQRQDEFQTEITEYIKGKPMEAMAPFIAKEDRIVAAFIVGIAMKESKFGIYAPQKNGRDCYNYWGYRGSENPTASGYSCFNSPEQAIQVVGKKIASLTARGISNPAEMISWKCGSTCAGHGAENVRKWIADVGVNFYKINS